MPHQNVRSACAIAQWAQGKNNFISPQYSDSASDGAPSSEELSPSSDEDDTAAHRLYNIHKGISKKQKIKNLKAPYTGDSQATKFCRQKHWKEAAKGCKKLDGYFPRYHNFSDGTFMTAKWLIPECLNMCDTLTIRRFFRKSWQYMDSYRKGLDTAEIVFTMHTYKSHRKVGSPAKIKKLMAKKLKLDPRTVHTALL